MRYIFISFSTKPIEIQANIQIDLFYYFEDFVILVLNTKNLLMKNLLII